MKFFNLRIKQKIVAMMIFIVVVPILILGSISYLFSSKSMEYQYKELGKTIGEETKRTIENQINEIEKEVEFLASSNNVHMIIENPEVSSILLDELRRFKDTYEIENAYLATVNGDLYVYPNVNLPSDYNPLDRDWYKDAIKKDSISWSNVYMDEASKENLVTVSKPVYKDSQLVGVIGIDIPFSIFSNSIKETYEGTADYPILVDRNGKVITYKDNSFIGKDFEGKEMFMNMTEENKIIEKEYENNGIVERQLVIVNNMKNVGWKVINIIPIDNIKSNSSRIMINTIITGVITTIAGLIIAIIFARTILKPIGRTLKSVRKMEEGDFTARLDIKNEDEFGEVRNGFNSMMDKLSTMILNIQDIARQVSGESETLAAMSEETSASSEEVSTTVKEIAKGSLEQAKDIELGVNLIEGLSDKLIELDNNSEVMLRSVEEVKQTSEDSIGIVGNLLEKAETNNTNTCKVEEEIINLDNKIGEIGNILFTIDQIAEQTNLLALNASIEAARAGEHGKGFAVVAEEIRKLAGESKLSSDNIKDIITNVQLESKKTVEVMKNVKEMNQEQTDIVFKVNESFRNINNLIEDITVKIESIGKYIHDINEDKNKVVNSIEDISAISEQTAASSESVVTSVVDQTTATEEVSRYAEKLNELANALNEKLGEFKVNLK
ncbi:methyl-accepting chemotaxis sensory transducer with Cache sensor Mcp [Gottschalkia acidurici 9a]|uniref:Methyl-accepting chemotaxis sensory transducer with Cache sensor Mcp n=1 Tax=Gottschalkia acidurici (strain ATCC 7906 / DSM 604 / BCRC 14475 / CIP 104303 / KCTC 5404 / NCIMB 10678 / 9a) TaxID=1128398 RepID=K0AX88_GOTA9|nr:methyl-accepting chemotaxis protein [Gottschalkia acidurici]AFS77360.1 methyl-accepting chemotaxis sensory transducer with Cache sensor Mcp [Gottschalkia acidurici 9a]